MSGAPVSTASLPHRDVADTMPRRASIHARARRNGPREELPADVIDTIRRMRAAEPKTGDRTDRANIARLPLDHYLHALWLADWPMHTLVAAYRANRQAIHNRMYRARRMPLPASVDLPPIPARRGPCGPDHMVGANVVRRPSGTDCLACEEAARRRRSPLLPARPGTIPGDIQARMRELAPVAATVNGATRADDPARAASMELTDLYRKLYADGYTYLAIAGAAGVTHSTVSVRLHRRAAPFRPTPPDAGPVPEGDARRIRELVKVSSTGRGHKPADHPSRVAATELVSIYGRLRNAGHTWAQVAAASGENPGTAMARVQRHVWREHRP